MVFKSVSYILEDFVVGSSTGRPYWIIYKWYLSALLFHQFEIKNNYTSVDPKQMWKSPMLHRDNGSWHKSNGNRLEQVGDKCKIMRPRAFRMATKCGRQWETHVKSRGPEHWEWETRVGDKCEVMRPRLPRVGDKSGRQVWSHAAQTTQSGRQAWETSGRQM